MQWTELSRLDRAEICCESGEQMLGRGAFEPARNSFLAALSLYPALAAAHVGLAKVERHLGRLKEAENAARSALEADPQHGRAAHYLGRLLFEQERLVEAYPLIQAAAVWDPSVAEHHRDLSVLQLFFGDVAGGRDSMLRALETDHHSREILYNIVRVTPMNDGSQISRRVLAIAEELAIMEEQLPALERAEVFFSLGKAYDDLGHVKDSAEYYARANAIRRSLITCDLAKIEDRYRRIAATFDRAFFDRLAGAGPQDARPILVVGMPRSGSTLVEQLISSHPEVHGAGEIYRFPQIVERTTGKDGARFPEWGDAMNAADCNSLGLAYLNGLPHGLAGMTRTTDKWLENLEYLAVICVSLPKARIIHCRRDPRDQLFSCWTTLFSNGQDYSYDMDELKRYWRAYDRLMTHWRNVLPTGRMLEVQYEELVRDPEKCAREITGHCGLDWDASVLRFWQARRPVKSASSAQVREPIYDRSIGRWKRFEESMKSLFEEIDPTGQSLTNDCLARRS